MEQEQLGPVGDSVDEALFDWTPEQEPGYNPGMSDLRKQLADEIAQYCENVMGIPLDSDGAKSLPLPLLGAHVVLVHLVRFLTRE